jgi:hypothetical protein
VQTGVAISRVQFVLSIREVPGAGY